MPHGIGALGYTLQRPSEDRHLLRRAELVDKMTRLPSAVPQVLQLA